MSTLQLYLATILIWGSTWLAIKFQLGIVPPAVSVVWRFALAAAMLLAYARWKGLNLRFSARNHAWMALQGLVMFGINYVCVYLSEQYLASGLVAVAFSLIVFCNIIAIRIFFGTPINLKSLFAALLGVAGVALVFWPEVADFSTSAGGPEGVILAIVGTVVASLGSIAAIRNQVHNHLPIIPLNGFAMLYGTFFVALYAAFSGDAFSFDWSFSYVASLIYLALFGSVLAFGAYLTLLKRIGADRAGYTGVAVPVIALLLSTLVENLHWQVPMVAGVALCVLGNVLMLRGTGKPAPTPVEELRG